MKFVSLFVSLCYIYIYTKLNTQYIKCIIHDLVITFWFSHSILFISSLCVLAPIQTIEIFSISYAEK